MKPPELLPVHRGVDSGLTLVRSTGTDPTAVLLHLVGELDIASATQLTSEVDEQIGRGRVHLCLDLGGLAFSDVVGLAALLDARRRVASVGGSLEVLRPSALLRQLALWCDAPELLDA